MIDLFASAYGSAKAAYEIAEGYIALKTATERNEAVIAIQRSVLEYQRTISLAEREYATSLKQIDALEAEISRLKDWSAEKNRYALQDTGQGSLAYRLKDGVVPPEPGHWICPNCYQDGKKSILKHEKLEIGRVETLVCHSCGFDILTRGVRHVQQRSSPARRTR